MSTAEISRFVLAHKRLVVAFWVVVTVVAALTVSRAVGALSQDFTVPGREGVETSQQIKETYGNGGDTAPLVVVASLPEGTTVDAAGVTAEFDALIAKVQEAAPAVRTAAYGSTGDRTFVSEDGRTTFGLVFVPAGQGFGEAPEVEIVRETVRGATVAGAPVTLTGYSELETGGESDESSVLVETLIGGLGALIVLAWVFGSFLAFVPLLMAAVSILTTFLVIWGLTTVTDVNLIVQFLVALIGLGVAIDYSLLIVTRWREERDGRVRERGRGPAGDGDGRQRRRLQRHDGGDRAAGARRLAGALHPLDRLRRHADPAGQRAGGDHAPAGLPRHVGPRLDWPRLRTGTPGEPRLDARGRGWSCGSAGSRRRSRWPSSPSSLPLPSR